MFKFTQKYLWTWFIIANIHFVWSAGLQTGSAQCPGHTCVLSNVWVESPCHVCPACKCDDRCEEYGDCCSDTHNESDAKHHSHPMFECTAIKTKDVSKQNYYFMVTTCSRESHDGIRDKCLSPNEAEVKSWLPVKARRDDDMWVTYRNQYCALCNGISPSEIKPWNVYMECEQNPPIVIPRFRAFDDIVDFVDSNNACKFTYDVLPGIPERECVTVPPRITECNVTGNWDYHNETVESRCRDDLMLFHVNGTYYRNHYCYLCNVNGSEYLPEEALECFRPLKGSEFIFTFLPGLPPLSMLINFNPSVEPETEDPDPVVCNCSRGHVYDVYAKTCRQVSCSNSMQDPENLCAPVFGYSKGLPFYINVVLTPVHVISINESEQIPMVTTVTQTIQKKLQDSPDVQILYIGYQVRFLLNRNNSRCNTSSPEFQCVLCASRHIGHIGTRGTTYLLEVQLEVYLVSEQITTFTTFSTTFTSFVKTQWNLKQGDNSYVFKGSISPNVSECHIISTGDLQIPISGEIEELYTRGFNLDQLESFRRYSPSVTVYSNETWSDTRETVTYERFTVLKKGHPLNSVPSFDSFLLITPLYNCSTVRLNASEYVENNASNEILIHGSETLLQYGDFLRYPNGDIGICSDLATDNHNPQACSTLNHSTNTNVTSWLLVQRIVTFVSLITSIVCLLLTFVTYCALKSLRTIPGLNNMFLSITIILAQTLYLVQAIDIDNDVLCKAVGILLHYLWLASFFWMNVCSFHVFIIFKNVWKSRGKKGCKRILVYMAYASFVPLLIVIATMASSFFLSGRTSIGYGGKNCYLSSNVAVGVSFALPLGVIVLLNSVFFIITMVAMKDSPKLQKNQEHKRSSLVYLRLSTLTGMTWIVGFIAAGTLLEPLWCLFTVLCGGQGLFMFLSFIANRRVLVKYKQLYRRYRKGKKETNAYTCASKTGDRRISVGNIFTLDTYSGLSSPTKDTVLHFKK